MFFFCFVLCSDRAGHQAGHLCGLWLQFSRSSIAVGRQVAEPKADEEDVDPLGDEPELDEEEQEEAEAIGTIQVLAQVHASAQDEDDDDDEDKEGDEDYDPALDAELARHLPRARGSKRTQKVSTSSRSYKRATKRANLTELKMCLLSQQDEPAPQPTAASTRPKRTVAAVNYGIEDDPEEVREAQGKLQYPQDPPT